ncbi:MAG TPA: uroporphyrinogen decarboxylase family protein [Chthonomonadales bacterium]|nr:uroporphyrinogen decarboxylase family protein [Chthonomonadales bacterium]
MSGRERVMGFLDGKPTDCLPCMPITMQFAADRIGAPYREYATDYRTLVRGQIHVAETFDLDYVNTMSDPACEAADLGAAVVFSPDAPPALDESCSLLEDKAHLAQLRVPDPLRPGSRMLNRVQAIALFKERVGGDKLIEGWIEGPIAQAADLRGINRVMLDLYDDPVFVRDVFEFVLAVELEFARAQVAAGADMIGIGDAAASLVGPAFYEEHVWPYEKRMVDGVRALGARVRLHICGNTRRILALIGGLGCDIVDLDYLVPVAEGRAAMGPEQVLLGNIDPVSVLRESTPGQVTEAVAACHRAAGARFIVGPGCETPRDTPDVNFRALVRYAKEHSA